MRTVCLPSNTFLLEDDASKQGTSSSSLPSCKKFLGSSCWICKAHLPLFRKTVSCHLEDVGLLEHRCRLSNLMAFWLRKAPWTCIKCEVERRCHARILSVSIINLLTYYHALYVSCSPCALARSAVAGQPFRKQFLGQALCCLRLRLEGGLSSFTLSLPAGRGNTSWRCRCPRPVRSITDPPTQHGEAATTAEGVFVCSFSPAHLLHHAVVDSPRCSSIDCQVNTNSCNAVAGGLEGLMTSG